MGGFERVVRGVSAAGLHVAAAACLVCFALMCYGVGMRYFVGEPQAWVDKVVGWLVVVMVMFAAPSAQLQGEHVAVDVVTERVGPRARRALGTFGLLWIVATAAFMVWEGWAMVAFSRLTGMMTDLHPVPLWWIQLLLPVGFVLMIAVAVLQLLRLARGLDAGDAGAEAEAARLKAGPLE